MLLIFMNQEKQLSKCLINYAKNMSRKYLQIKQGTGLKILTPKQMIANSSCTNKSRQ